MSGNNPPYDENIFQCAQEILQKRIRNVVCIDDEYVGSYGNNRPDPDDGVMPLERELYKGLTDVTGGIVVMLRYDKNFDQCKQTVNNADMVVLDWELKGDNGFKDALCILDHTLQSTNCSLICIYTKSEDRMAIYNIIETYYLGKTKEEWDSIRKKVMGTFLENTKGYEEGVEKLLFTGSTDLMDTIRGLEKKRPDDTKKLSGANLKTTDEIVSFLKGMYFFSKYQDVAPFKFDGKCVRLFSQGNSELVGLNINGKIVSVFTKGKPESLEDNINIATPNNLFECFSKNVVSSPNNIYNLIWIDYQNMIIDISKEKSIFLNEIPDTTLHFLKNKIGDESFEKELRLHFVEEISHRMKRQQYEINPSILSYIEHCSTDELQDADIVKFNSYYSQLFEEAIEGKKVSFGDLFQIEDIAESNDEDRINDCIAVCITAHCDCEHNSEITKIKKNYSFAIGRIIEKQCSQYKSYLKNPESPNRGLVDFIKISKEHVMVKWDDYFVKFYLKQNKIDSEQPLLSSYKGRSVKLKYIGTLKENYAQRIANRLFSLATRVGITYLGKEKKQNKQENC